MNRVDVFFIDCLSKNFPFKSPNVPILMNLNEFFPFKEIKDEVCLKYVFTNILRTRSFFYCFAVMHQPPSIILLM